MERLYYACWYRLDGVDAYLIWYTATLDGVVMDQTGHVPTFSNTDALQTWARAQNLEVYTEELILHNLDVVQEWVRCPANDTIDCKAFLNVWNLFIDVQTSIEQRDVLGEDRINGDLYDKVFFGNNLPAMTPPDEHYVPEWTDEEVERLQAVLCEGFRLFREYSCASLASVCIFYV